MEASSSVHGQPRWNSPHWLREAFQQAKESWDEGGLPIGAVLIDAEGRVVARGHNERVQSGDPTSHAEITCMRHAGRRRDWNTLTLVTTLSPCAMCTGATILFGIPRVVIGENLTFQGREDWLEQQGVEVIRHRDADCIALMRRLQHERPDLWREDIGLPPQG
ncbi:MAG TPA: nucleoside deaminase [Planctomycetes bacterium]|nr:nucleoside deaminase [Planctomycetota bacterium]